MANLKEYNQNRLVEVDSQEDLPETSTNTVANLGVRNFELGVLGLILVFIIIGLIPLLFGYQSLFWTTVIPTIFLGTASSLLASLIVARHYTATNEKQQLEVIGDKLYSKIKPEVTGVKENIKLEFKEVLAEVQFEHIPLRTFEASDVANQEYQNVFVEGLRKSQFVKVKTVRGNFLHRLWVPQAKYGSKNISFQILLLHPESVGKYFEYIKFPSRRTEDLTVNFVREDIGKTIVQLYRCKDCAEIEIRLYEDSIFYRSEIFNDFAVVSYYEKFPPPTRFPRAFQYKSGGVQYNAFAADFEQTWSLSNKNRILLNGSTEDQIKEFLITQCRFNEGDFTKLFINESLLTTKT